MREPGAAQDAPTEHAPTARVPTERAPWVCALCGNSSSDAAEQLSWSVGTERGRVHRVCPACSRTYLRSIESKLDSDWW